MQEYNIDIEHMQGSKDIIADIFSRFHFPEKEATSNKNNDDSKKEYLMGILDEIHMPLNIYKIISECHNTFV